MNQHEDKVLEYDNIFKIGNKANINKLKITLIKQLIQINRPANWTMENIRTIYSEIINIETYNTRKFKNNKKIETG